jgi:delta-aminolevulinic acid dehydratase/porphobilinogen synthase
MPPTPTVAVLTPQEVQQLADAAASSAANRALEGVQRQMQALTEAASAARGVFTQKQLCEYLSVGEDTVRRYRQAGLRCYRVGRDPLYLLEDVIAFIRGHPDDAPGASKVD